MDQKLNEKKAEYISENNDETNDSKNSITNNDVLTFEISQDELVMGDLPGIDIAMDYKCHFFSLLSLNLFVKGMGFFNDAYDLFVMNIVNVILEKQYKAYSGNIKSYLSTSVFIGAIIGQIVLGSLGDKIGRTKIMIISCSLLIIGGLSSSLVYASNDKTMFWLLTIYRGILGIGIGGEYPLAASSSVEDISPTKRLANVAMIFSLQGVGSLAASIIALILISIFANENNNNLEIIWRLLFGIGTIPALSIFYYRWKAKESHDFRRRAQAMDTQGYGNLTYNERIGIIWRHYKWQLFGTAMGWCLFDIFFYAQAIFSDSIFSENENKLLNISIYNVYLALAALPGYWVTVCLITRLGRRKIQLQGFILCTILLAIMAICWSQIKNIKAVLILLYVLFFFFVNFGPNATTFVLPTEVFPIQIRATCHGISAAAGKIGAAIGTATFVPFSHTYGIAGTFIFCAIISLMGSILTFFFVHDGPNDPKRLETLYSQFVSQDCDLGHVKKHKLASPYPSSH